MSFFLLLLCLNSPDLTDLKQAIEAQHEAYLKTLKSADASAHGEIFTRDAWVLSPGLPTVRGRDAIIRDKQAIFVQAKIMGGVIKTEHLEQHGDMAIEIGRFSYTVKVGKADPRIIEGKFVTIWKRQEDGIWRYYIDAGLPD